ncbi:hypothetical protein Hanom_Chr08g00710141 [Helianthus anomalus]
MFLTAKPVSHGYIIRVKSSCRSCLHTKKLEIYNTSQSNNHKCKQIVEPLFILTGRLVSEAFSYRVGLCNSPDLLQNPQHVLRALFLIYFTRIFPVNHLPYVLQVIWPHIFVLQIEHKIYKN